jgi:hypothetical protein
MLVMLERAEATPERLRSVLPFRFCAATRVLKPEFNTGMSGGLGLVTSLRKPRKLAVAPTAPERAAKPLSMTSVLQRLLSAS